MHNIIFAWLWRRAQEIAGWGTVVYPLYLAMPETQKAVIHAILTGQGGGLSISAAIGFAIYAFSQFQSFRSTVRPQVVTADKQQIPLPKESLAQTKVEAIARSAPVRGRTMIEILRDTFRR